jgi:hypothetical protein
MPTFIVAPRPPSPTGRGAVVAVVAGAAMGALAGARVACHLGGLLLFGGCFPAGAQLGALVAVAALPLLGEGPGGASTQGWARWAAAVAFSLLGTTALAGLADWIALFLRTRAGPTGFEPAPVDLITPLVFLAVCVGVVVLLLTPTTRGDFQSSGQPGTPSPSGR